MLLIAEAGIRGGMCNQYIDMLKQIINTWKNYDKKIDSSYQTYLGANNLYGWTMSQKLPINGFMWYNSYLSEIQWSVHKKLQWK